MALPAVAAQLVNLLYGVIDKIYIGHIEGVGGDALAGVGITYNKEIEEYNRVAVDIAKKYGFEINDLYEVSVSIADKAHSDSVHYYTPMGTEAFTNKVLSYIAPALGLENVPEYKEELHTDKPVGI